METLARALDAIDGHGYGAYKRIEGSYALPGCTLFVDHVQGDPYASPSRIRVRVPQELAQLPLEFLNDRVRHIAINDFLARAVQEAIPEPSSSGSGKSGRLFVDAGHQEVLERTAVVTTRDWVEARIEIGLPANGRRINAREARRLLITSVSEIAARALTWARIDDEAARSFVRIVEQQEQIRAQLADRGLVTFVGDGAVLARESGVSDRPRAGAIPFTSPASMKVELTLSDGTTVSGMGVPCGVTLIVGGGYHGKSTLLQALQNGVYPHIPGDGRERVVTRHDAVKVRAEEGRSIAAVDISPFIRELPGGSTATDFSSDDASGSTSQAASILEAIEVGAQVLFLDEDSSATNFMIRDGRMRALIAPEQEPIIPFVERVRELFDEHHISTVLVMGGSGAFFDAADNVIKMVDYVPADVTEDAKRIVDAFPTGGTSSATPPFSTSSKRAPVVESIDPRGQGGRARIDAHDRSRLRFGAESLELAGVEQLVERSQARAAARAIYFAARRFTTSGMNVGAMMLELEELFDANGLDIIGPGGADGRHPGNLARPRRFEIAACLNRLRSLRMEIET